MRSIAMSRGSPFHGRGIRVLKLRLEAPGDTAVSFGEDTVMRCDKATGGRTLEQLISSHVRGHSLERDFYVDERVYQADLARIWRPGWLFAGHSCEIAAPGDYFTLDLERDSLIVLRDDDGGLH